MLRTLTLCLITALSTPLFAAGNPAVASHAKDKVRFEDVRDDLKVAKARTGAKDCTS